MIQSRRFLRCGSIAFNSKSLQRLVIVCTRGSQGGSASVRHGQTDPAEASCWPMKLTASFQKSQASLNIKEKASGRLRSARPLQPPARVRVAGDRTHGCCRCSVCACLLLRPVRGCAPMSRAALLRGCRAIAHQRNCVVLWCARVLCCAVLCAHVQRSR